MLFFFFNFIVYFRCEFFKNNDNNEDIAKIGDVNNFLESFPEFKLFLHHYHYDLKVFNEITMFMNKITKLFENDSTWLNKAVEYLLRRNELLSPINQILSACLRCNTAAVFIGSLESAKSMSYYLVDYLTKDKFEMNQILSLIHYVRGKISRFPSTADNTGTSERTAQHFLSVMVNKFLAMDEVAPNQSASALLGFKTFESSHKIHYIFIESAMAFVSTNLYADDNIKDRDAWEDIFDFNDEFKSHGSYCIIIIF